MILLNNICLFLNKIYKYIYYNYCIYKDIEENVVDEKFKKNDDYKNDCQTVFAQNYKEIPDSDPDDHNFEFDYEIIENNNNNTIVHYLDTLTTVMDTCERAIEVRIQV